MLTGAFPAIYGGQLADRFGILNIVAAGAVFYMVVSVMEAAAFQIAVFIVGRALTGLGMGLWLSNVNKPITVPEQELDELNQNTREKPGMLRMIFQRRVRPRTLLAFFLLFMEGMCGIDGILYYAPILFENAGLSETTAGFLASGVSAILMTVVSILAIVVPDRFGRRAGVIVGAAGMAACLLIMGALYAGDAVHNHGVGRWVVIVILFLYQAHYCCTWAVSGKIYASEIRPITARAAANNIATGLNFFANWLVAFVTPIFLAKSTSGAYFLYGASNTVSVLVLLVCMPETTGRPLEEMDEIFEHPMWKGWMHYRPKLIHSKSKNRESAEVGLQTLNATPTAEGPTRRKTKEGIEGNLHWIETSLPPYYSSFSADDNVKEGLSG
ncbi:MAG: hypothetical protein Q9165_002226 [Trypethelium subeluteriae]